MPANLEMKARYADLEEARRRLAGWSVRERFTMTQLDTYFRAANGRLKLREIEREDERSAELIWYQRPDAAAAKTSTYQVVPVAEPIALKQALSAAMGERGVVHKTREVLLWENVRIHLDEVAELGTFIEFEAVLGPDDGETVSARRLEELEDVLGIEASSQVAVGYADLLGI